MNLQQAIFETRCDVLRSKLVQFTSDIAHNIIPTYFCPICSTDLRSSYEPAMQNNGRGKCRVCLLGIQMNHFIQHDGHINADHSLCAYSVTLPVALVVDGIVKKLHEKWSHMKLPRRVLVGKERHDWLTEVQTLVKGAKIDA